MIESWHERIDRAIDAIVAATILIAVAGFTGMVVGKVINSLL